MARMDITNRLDDSDLNAHQNNYKELYAGMSNAQAAKILLENFLNGSGVVNSTMLADYVVTTDKLGLGAVTKSRLGTPSVDGENIYTGAITPSKIADNAIGTRHILDKQVTGVKIADKTIGKNNIVNWGVGTDQIDQLAVTTDKLGLESVTNSRLSKPSVNGENLYTGSVSASKIVDNAVAERHILNRQVTRSKLSHDFLFNRLVASNEPIESVLTDGTYQIAPNNTGDIPEELIANDHFSMSVEVVGNFAYQTLFRLTDPSMRFVRVINTLDNVIRPWHKFNFGNSTNGGHMPRKIFMIGNSFSLNSTEYLHHLCAEAGIDITIGVMYRAGESLESHYTNLQNESANYTYYERISENGVARSVTTPNQSLRDGARKHAWDTVMFLQRPEMSGDYSTFNPYLDDLISMVKTEVSADIKVGLMQTWSFSKVKDPNADVMYSNIVSAFDEVMYESNIEYIIPIGTAIQNARSNDRLNAVDEELTSDGIHLGNLGKYIAALTGFESLFPNSSCKALEYTPQGVTNYQKYNAKLAANNANLNPKITVEL